MRLLYGTDGSAGAQEALELMVASLRSDCIASELATDLLVVGSRGLSGIQRFLLGSTSAALLANPPTSVLVARMTGG